MIKGHLPTFPERKARPGQFIPKASPSIRLFGVKELVQNCGFVFLHQR